MIAERPAAVIKPVAEVENDLHFGTNLQTKSRSIRLMWGFKVELSFAASFPLREEDDSKSHNV